MMTDLHSMGHSAEIYQHEIIEKWNRKAEKELIWKLSCLAALFFSASQPLVKTRTVLEKLFFEVLGFEKPKTFPRRRL